MNNPLILTFDIGTQSIRAALVEKDGSFAALSKNQYTKPFFSPEPFSAEQTPDFYFEALCNISKKLLSENENLINRIIAVGITTVRDTVVCLDKSFSPLRNIILWTDKRSACFKKPFGQLRKLLFSAVGMYETAKMQYINSPCNWLKQNEPQVWNKTEKFVYLSAFLNLKLTGNLLDSPANCIGHMPFNYKKGEWDKGFSLTKPIYDIPYDKLCELTNSGEKIGNITKQASFLTHIPEGLPLFAPGSDKACETVGVGAVKKGLACVSLGTTASIQITSKKYISPKTFIPAFPAAVKELYNTEIQIYSGFRLITLFMEIFGSSDNSDASFDEFNRASKKISAGSQGLFVYPYWTADIIKPKAKGAIIGITDEHTPFHLYKAIIEGILFELYSGLLRLEKRSSTKIEKIYISGGGAKSDTICQICADIFNKPVVKIQTSEASSLGAAMSVFVAMKEFSDIDEAIKSMSHEKQLFYPNTRQSEEYKKIFRLRKKYKF